MEFPEIKMSADGAPVSQCVRAIGIKRGIVSVQATIDKCSISLNNNEVVNLYRTVDGLRVTRLFPSGMIANEDGTTYLLALRMYRGQIINMQPIEHKRLLVQVQQLCGSYMDVSGLPTADYLCVEEFDYSQDCE